MTTEKYTVVHAMDPNQKPLGVMTVKDGHVQSFEPAEGKTGNPIGEAVRFKWSLNELVGRMRMMTFVPLDPVQEEAAVEVSAGDVIKTGTDSDKLRSILDSLGADVTGEEAQGVCDFDLHGTSGLAYLKDRSSVFRASFFLALNVDRYEAREWVESNQALPEGELQLIERADGDVVRVLVERPIALMTSDVCARIRWTVQALAEAWRTHP